MSISFPARIWLPNRLALNLLRRETAAKLGAKANPPRSRLQNFGGHSVMALAPDLSQSIAHAWIDQHVTDINDQIHEKDDQSREEHRAHNHGHVLVRDSLIA
jgi:hypothetical protein